MRCRTIIEDMTIHNLKEEASNAAKANNCDRINLYILEEKKGLVTNTLLHNLSEPHK